MSNHIINLYNRDTISGSLIKIGTMTARHSTGEAYVTIEPTTGVTKEIPMKAAGYRQFMDLLNKNKITTTLPSTLTELENRTHVFVDGATTLPETLPTVSVTDVLVERTMSEVAEWSKEASVDSISLKRLSYKTLGKDVEVEDLRLDPDSPLEIMGTTDIESLLNYMIDLQLDLDPLFDKTTSNSGLTTDVNGYASDKLKLRLRTMDNPMTETNEANYANKVLTGAAGLEIKNKFEQRINALKIFNKVKVTNTDYTGAVQEKIIEASDKGSTIKFATNEADGIMMSVENNALVVRHSVIGNTTTNAAFQAGKVMAIGSISTDDKGHIVSVGTKDLNAEIGSMYYDKATADARYIKKTNSGTEVLNGSLQVNKSIHVVKDLYVGGNMYFSGENANIEAEEFTAKDNIVEIGTGSTTSQQYTGIKLVKATSGGVDNEGRDAFILFDNTNKQFTTLFGRTTELDPNTVYDIVLAPIKADTFLGNATTATAFKNPVKIQFMGSATGAVEFYGNENSIIAELNVNEATTTTFGTVRMVDSLDDGSALELNDVYSAQLLQPVLLAILNDFKVTSTYDMTEEDGSTEYVATSKAVYDVYQKLVAFRKKYDETNYYKELAALSANTTEITNTGMYIDFPLTDDTSYINRSISGYGYDIRNYDSSIPLAGVTYPETWNAHFKLIVAGYSEASADNSSYSIVKNIMPRSKVGELYRISYPRLQWDAAAYSMTAPVDIAIMEYDDGNVSPSNGKVLAYVKGVYYTNEAYNEIDNKAAANRIPVDRFYNYIDLKDFFDKSTIGAALTATKYVTAKEKQILTINSVNVSANNQHVGMLQMVGPYRDLLGQQAQPALFLGGNNVENGNAVTCSGMGITLPAIGIDSTDPYALMFYFKLDTESSLVDSYDADLTFSLEETYTSLSPYGFRIGGRSITRTSTIFSITQAEMVSTFKNNNWYCGVGFIHTQGSSFVDTDQLGGIYDVQDAANASDYKKKTIHYSSFPKLLSSTYKVTSRRIVVRKGTGYGVYIATYPVLTKFDTDGRTAMLAAVMAESSNLTFRSRDAIFLDYTKGVTTNNDTVNYSYVYTTTSAATSKPNKCYEINVINTSKSQKFKPNASELVLSSDTNFGTDPEDYATLLDPLDTSRQGTDVSGYTYTVQQDKCITVFANVYCDSRTQESASADVWVSDSPIPATEEILKDRYFAPSSLSIIHVSLDNTLAIPGPMTYRYSPTTQSWYGIGDMFSNVRWLPNLSYIAGLDNYKPKVLGQIVVVITDNSTAAVAAGMGGLTTWYYYTDKNTDETSRTAGWKIMPTRYTTDLSEYVVSESVYDYTLLTSAQKAIELIQSQDTDEYNRYVVLKHSSGIKHWYQIVTKTNGVLDVQHLGVYQGSAVYMSKFANNSDMGAYLLDPAENDATKVAYDTNRSGAQTWYRYEKVNGVLTWNYKGEYLDFDRKCNLQSTKYGGTNLTINNIMDINTFYYNPNEGDYARVGTGSSTTDTYYQYVDSNWVTKGVISGYTADYPYLKCTGSLNVTGQLRFPFSAAYSVTKTFTLT